MKTNINQKSKSLRLDELIDLDELKSLMFSFSATTSYSFGVRSFPEKALYFGVQWRKICTDFHQSKNKHEHFCSNKTLNYKVKNQTVNIHTCKNGFVTATVPIIINNKHIADVFTGVVLFKTADKKQIEEEALENNYNIDSYKKAIEELPIVKREELNASLVFLSQMIESLAQKKLLQNKEIEEREEIKKIKSDFEIIASTSQDVVFLITKDGKQIYLSNSIHSILGYTVEENLGTHFLDFIPESEHKRCLSKFAEVFHNGNVSSFITKSYHKNGSLIDIELDGCLIEYRGIQVIRGSLKDITKRITAEKQLKKLESAVIQSSNMIVITNKNAEIEYVNPSFEKHTGYSLKEVLGKNPKILKSDHHNPDYYKKMWKTLSNKQNWEGEFININKEGKKYWEKASISPIIDKQGNITNYVGVKIDVTAHKAQQQKLIEREIYYKTLIEKSADVISIVDKKGIIKYNSFSHKEILGYDNDEIKGKSVFDYIHPEDLKLVLLQFTYSKQEPSKTQKINFRFKHKNGKWINIEGTARNLISNPLIKGIIVNYRDVTIQKQLDRDLYLSKEKAQESDRLKTIFLQNMSHEIRTPLNAIIGFSDILNRLKSEDPEVSRYSSIINKSGNRLLELINNILYISKIESGTTQTKEELINLNELLTNTKELFIITANKKGIELITEFDLEDRNSNIRVDVGKLNQIFTNLVNNALKFTKKGSIKISYKIIDNEIRFSVEDTGLGISEKNQTELFNRFYQVDQSHTRTSEGLGLGLSITKGLVSLLNGKIWLESVENKGTTFFFTIPFKVAKKSNKKLLSTHNNKLSNKHLKILIAEDDLNSYELAKVFLSKYNTTIVHATNGAEAVEYCNNEIFDLILMDINMPVLNGLDATRIIKQKYPDLPIIAQTAYAYSTEMEEVLDAGCNAYISKPYSEKVLSDKIRGLFKK